MEQGPCLAPCPKKGTQWLFGLGSDLAKQGWDGRKGGTRTSGPEHPRGAARLGVTAVGASPPRGSRHPPHGPVVAGTAPSPPVPPQALGHRVGGGGLGGCRRKRPRAPQAICSSAQLNRAPHLCRQRGERIPHPKIAACRALPSRPWKMLINTRGGTAGEPPPRCQGGPQNSLLWSGVEWGGCCPPHPPGGFIWGGI